MQFLKRMGVSLFWYVLDFLLNVSVFVWGFITGVFWRLVKIALIFIVFYNVIFWGQ